nr:unnamed protein product [Spirometra erinaceieuropaei]
MLCMGGASPLLVSLVQACQIAPKCRDKSRELLPNITRTERPRRASLDPEQHHPHNSICRLQKHSPIVTPAPPSAATTITATIRDHTPDASTPQPASSTPVTSTIPPTTPSTTTTPSISTTDCTRIRTAAYHPAANQMVERFLCQLKASLRVTDDPDNWKAHLPLVLLGVRSSLKPDFDCSASELVLGTTVRLPGEMIPPSIEMRSKIPPTSCAVFGTDVDTPRFRPDHLFPSLTSRKTWRRAGDVRTMNFRIQRGTREEIVSMDRLRADFPNTLPDEPSGSIPPAPSPRPSIAPSRILPLPP